VKDIENKTFEFPYGEITLHYIGRKISYVELTGSFISSVRVALYPEAVEALKTIINEL